MAKYGIGGPYRGNYQRLLPPSFKHYYLSIDAARAALYKEAIGQPKGQPETIWIYDLSKDEPRQIGFGYRSKIGPDNKVYQDKMWVLYENMNVPARLHRTWYLNKDGSLGKRY